MATTYDMQLAYARHLYEDVRGHMERTHHKASLGLAMNGGTLVLLVVNADLWGAWGLGGLLEPGASHDLARLVAAVFFALGLLVLGIGAIGAAWIHTARPRLLPMGRDAAETYELLNQSDDTAVAGQIVSWYLDSAEDLTRHASRRGKQINRALLLGACGVCLVVGAAFVAALGR